MFWPRLSKTAIAMSEIIDCDPSIELPNGNSGRVLIVEDDPDMAELVSDILSDDFSCCTVSGAEAAFMALIVGSFDVMFTDICMPGMDGLELARCCRRLYPDMQIVLTSGYYRDQWDGPAPEFPFVRKPYRSAALTAEIERAVERARALR